MDGHVHTERGISFGHKKNEILPFFGPVHTHRDIHPEENTFEEIKTKNFPEQKKYTDSYYL
jgi:hypothetical protein